jgi:hypothetical protein
MFGPRSPFDVGRAQDATIPSYQDLGGDPRLNGGQQAAPFSVGGWQSQYFYKCGPLATNWDPIACFASSGPRILYELDFTAQSSQTISADGNVTIDGKVWEAQNFAVPTLENAIVNGVGWRTQWAAANLGNVSSGQVSAPRLVIPLTDLVATANVLETRTLQLWMQYSTAGWDGNFSGPQIGYEYRTPGDPLMVPDTHYRVLRTSYAHRPSGVANEWTNLTVTGWSSNQNIFSTANTVGGNPDVLMVDLVDGFERGDCWLGNTVAGAWPVAKEMTPVSQLCLASNTIAGVITGWPGPQTIRMKDARLTLAMIKPSVSVGTSVGVIQKVRLISA